MLCFGRFLFPFFGGLLILRRGFLLGADGIRLLRDSCLNYHDGMGGCIRRLRRKRCLEEGKGKYEKHSIHLSAPRVCRTGLLAA